jgi:pentatricopeptide repeat protein
MKSEVLFNTIISGYKKEGRGNEAESILRKMISLEKDGYDRCRPDMITYAQVIEAVSFIFVLINFGAVSLIHIPVKTTEHVSTFNYSVG